MFVRKGPQPDGFAQRDKGPLCPIPPSACCLVEQHLDLAGWLLIWLSYGTFKCEGFLNSLLGVHGHLKGGPLKRVRFIREGSIYAVVSQGCAILDNVSTKSLEISLASISSTDFSYLTMLLWKLNHRICASHLFPFHSLFFIYLFRQRLLPHTWDEIQDASLLREQLE